MRKFDDNTYVKLKRDITVGSITITKDAEGIVKSYQEITERYIVDFDIKKGVKIREENLQAAD